MEVLMKNFKQFLESIDYYKIPGLSQEPLEPKVRVTPSDVEKEKDREEKKIIMLIINLIECVRFVEEVVKN